MTILKEICMPWVGKLLSRGKTSNNLYEEGDVWTEEENPRLVGFRVPTLNEWDSVLADVHNSKMKIYDGNKITGWKVGNNLMLFSRSKKNYGSFWSTSIYNNDASCVFANHEMQLRFFMKSSAHAVRCIKKLPNE